MRSTMDILKHFLLAVGVGGSERAAHSQKPPASPPAESGSDPPSADVAAASKKGWKGFWDKTARPWVWLHRLPTK